MAIADVFDALIHTRPYKPAWSTADAIEEMRAQRGKQFDPTLLDEFLSLDRAGLLEPVGLGTER